MPAPNAPPLARLLERTADAVAAVRAGRSLTAALDTLPADVRPGVLALASDVMRQLGTAQALRARLAPRAPPAPVEALLLSALALLVPRDDGTQPYAEHTLVDQAVQAARLVAPSSTGFVNAVLRRFVRERVEQLQAVRHQEVAAYNHPLWWIERVRQDWPAQWRELLAASNAPPPMVLRVNARRATAADYVTRLVANGRAGGGPARRVAARPVPGEPAAGFHRRRSVGAGPVGAARRAPLLLGAGLRAGARVLDACAAPGGKTAHLLELADLDVTALRCRCRALAAHAAGPAAPAPERQAALRRCAPHGHLVGPPAVRRGAARCAVQCIGHRAASSRCALVAPCRRPGRAGAHAGRTAGCTLADAGAGRSVAVCDLFDLSCRRPAADRRFFATPGRATRVARGRHARSPAAAAGQ